MLFSIAGLTFRRNVVVTTAILQKRFMSINVDISQAHNLRKKYVLLEADPSMHLPASSARSGLNSKIISFVRHAEGIHNAVRCNSRVHETSSSDSHHPWLLVIARQRVSTKMNSTQNFTIQGFCGILPSHRLAQSK